MIEREKKEKEKKDLYSDLYICFCTCQFEYSI